MTHSLLVSKYSYVSFIVPTTQDPVSASQGFHLPEESIWGSLPKERRWLEPNETFWATACLCHIGSLMKISSVQCDRGYPPDAASCLPRPTSPTTRPSPLSPWEWDAARAQSLLHTPYSAIILQTTAPVLKRVDLEELPGHTLVLPPQPALPLSLPFSASGSCVDPVGLTQLQASLGGYSVGIHFQPIDCTEDLALPSRGYLFTSSFVVPYYFSCFVNGVFDFTALYPHTTQVYQIALMSAVCFPFYLSALISFIFLR